MLRGVDRWGLGYLGSALRREKCVGKRHLLVCIADHFEPFDRTILEDGSITGGASDLDARQLVKEWCSDYRRMLGEFRDSDGVAPRHTFFYPWDEYDAGCLDELGQFCRDGFGEVEVHLHHRNDSEDGVRQKLTACRDMYAIQHGLLGRRREKKSKVSIQCSVEGRENGEVGESEHRTSNIERSTSNGGALRAKDQGASSKRDEVAYAFVHGNWCLCNGRPDGDWCGVDRELSILEDTGCYADLTFPSAPSPTQTRSVNTIYYGRDPREGERGVQAGERLKAEIGDIQHPTSNVSEPRTKNQELSTDSGVVMIPGPLGLNWGSRKFGLVPRLENGEVSGVNPATVERLRIWNRIGVHVQGCPEWVVVKLHTHGACRENRAALLGEQMATFHRDLAEACEQSDFGVHYVSARELFNIVKAAECGLGGDPGQYRNHEVQCGF